MSHVISTEVDHRGCANFEEDDIRLLSVKSLNSSGIATKDVAFYCVDMKNISAGENYNRCFEDETPIVNVFANNSFIVTSVVSDRSWVGNKPFGPRV